MYTRIKRSVMAIDIAAAWVICVFFVDRDLASYLHSSPAAALPALQTGMVLDLGHTVPFLALCGVLLLAAALVRDRRADWFPLLLGAVVLARLTSDGLKLALGRARPDLFFADGVYRFDFFKLADSWNSCPSTHAAVCASLAIGLSAMMPRCRWTIFAAASAAAISPVMAGDHFLSDALIGFVVGTTAALGWKTFLDRPGVA